jgi:hypothetical protein
MLRNQRFKYLHVTWQPMRITQPFRMRQLSSKDLLESAEGHDPPLAWLWEKPAKTCSSGSIGLRQRVVGCLFFNGKLRGQASSLRRAERSRLRDIHNFAMRAGSKPAKAPNAVADSFIEFVVFAAQNLPVNKPRLEHQMVRRRRQLWQHFERCVSFCFRELGSLLRLDKNDPQPLETIPSEQYRRRDVPLDADEKQRRLHLPPGFINATDAVRFKKRNPVCELMLHKFAPTLGMLRHFAM